MMLEIKIFLKSISKINYIIMSLFIIILLTFGIFMSYIFNNKTFEAKELNNNVILLKDEISKDDFKYINENYMDNIYAVKNEMVTLNGENVYIKLFYYTILNKDRKSSVAVLRECYVSGKRIDDINVIGYADDMDSARDVVSNDYVGFDNILKDTNGKDEYLILDLLLYGENKDYGNNSYIVNKTGKVLKKINTIKPGRVYQIVVALDKIDGRNSAINDAPALKAYDGDYLLYTNGSMMDIYDNYVYYIVGDCKKMQEFKLSVDNGQLNDIYMTDYNNYEIAASGIC